MDTIKRNIAIICNPLAGSGRAVQLAETIATEISKRNIQHTTFTETWPSAFEGFSDVWIVGGDGTLNHFVNLFPAIQLPLVIFNGGTGNDFHWLLYGNTSFEDQLQLALSANPKPIDLGKCNDRFFINGVGIGFEGEVARSLTGKKKRPGKASFMATILKKIFSYRSAVYQIIADGITYDWKKYLIIDASNGCRAGGGFHIAPEARANDGLLDLVMVNAISPSGRLRWLPVIEKGKHLHLTFIKHSKVKTVLVSSNVPIQYHLDGEYYEATKLVIEIVPGRLRFRY